MEYVKIKRNFLEKFCKRERIKWNIQGAASPHFSPGIVAKCGLKVETGYKEVKMVKQTVSYDNSLEKLGKEGTKKMRIKKWEKYFI